MISLNFAQVIATLIWLSSATNPRFSRKHDLLGKESLRDLGIERTVDRITKSAFPPACKLITLYIVPDPHLEFPPPTLFYVV